MAAKELTIEERIEKLPLWAQRHIGEQDAKIAQLEEELSGIHDEIEAGEAFDELLVGLWEHVARLRAEENPPDTLGWWRAKRNARILRETRCG
jgi:hypothetical protein